jgi:hypothetical protein
LTSSYRFGRWSGGGGRVDAMRCQVRQGGGRKQKEPYVIFPYWLFMNMSHKSRSASGRKSQPHTNMSKAASHVLRLDANLSHNQTQTYNTLFLSSDRSRMPSKQSTQPLTVYRGFIASRSYDKHTEERNFHLCWEPSTAKVLITRTGYPSIDIRVDRDISAIYVHQALLPLYLN